MMWRQGWSRWRRDSGGVDHVLSWWHPDRGLDMWEKDGSVSTVHFPHPGQLGGQHPGGGMMEGGWWRGMMEFLFSGDYWVKLISHKSKPVNRIYGFQSDLSEPIEALEFVINDLKLVIKTTLFRTLYTLCLAYLKSTSAYSLCPYQRIVIFISSSYQYRLNPTCLLSYLIPWLYQTKPWLGRAACPYWSKAEVKQALNINK